MTKYWIPHNFAENGRVFGIFEKEKVKMALVWAVPVTIVVLYLLPASIFCKSMLEILLVCPVAAFFLLGLDDVALGMAGFFRKRGTYFLDSETTFYTDSHDKKKGGGVAVL